MRQIAKRLDAFAEATGGCVAWLTVALTLVTVVDVCARYFFNAGSVGLQELEWHLFALIFLLATGYTLRHDDHVRVDIFYAKLPRKGQCVIDLAGSLLLLLPFCILIITSSVDFVANSWAMGESSGDPGGLPARYLLKGAIVVGFGLLALQGLSEALKAVVGFRGDDT